ncbi:hypothetical protein LWI29_030463 [Acer saccharum]|uniref:Uncharacterized protein n=1 Tax=Acer saccharum TaxID=4024 RepID=A0AA39W915_ACESA|nr:hypothetical protein LWI29_030463 [Acer saccharum]
MEKRVDGGGGGGGGGDGHHVHKLPSSFFKYDNVRCYTTDSDTEDEKPNEHDYPSTLDDTFVGVEASGTGLSCNIAFRTYLPQLPLSLLHFLILNSVVEAGVFINDFSSPNKSAFQAGRTG